MTDGITDITNFLLPFNKTVDLKHVEYQGGIDMIRATFREGRRFTTIELDPDSARKLSTELMAWADRQGE